MNARPDSIERALPANASAACGIRHTTSLVILRSLVVQTPAFLSMLTISFPWTICEKGRRP
ncbi:hypothetical protein BDI4_410027 [Burkholderia diffusa]|nr:hypothetical protein BDI4_410027 [Burkholderia diffusa]